MSRKTDLCTIERGLAAEERVAASLIAGGYRVAERNFRWRGGEIDLVALDGEVLVFLEVRSSAQPSPWLRHSISPAKRRRIIKTAWRFLAAREWARGRAFRFDVVWVEGAAIEHWRNVALTG